MTRLIRPRRGVPAGSTLERGGCHQPRCRLRGAGHGRDRAEHLIQPLGADLQDLQVTGEIAQASWCRDDRTA